jgi:hypothetical protein
MLNSDTSCVRSGVSLRVGASGASQCDRSDSELVVGDAG